MGHCALLTFFRLSYILYKGLLPTGYDVPPVRFDGIHLTAKETLKCPAEESES